MPTADPTVIAALQRSASLHLTAIEHYTAVGEHLARWGYPSLGTKYRGDADEERDHLGRVIARLEYFDAQVDYSHAAPSWPRHDFAGILMANLSLEDAAASAERANILAARAAGDEMTALVFANLLHGSEESIRDIEATQRVIAEIGLDNFLANQT